MNKTLIYSSLTISVLWILYGIVSFFLEIDLPFLLLTHLSFLVILTFLFVFLLNVTKNEQKRSLLELEATQKLEWEVKMHELRNSPAKTEHINTTIEITQNQ